MFSTRFYIQIIFRTVLIVISTFFVFFFIGRQERIFTLVGLFIVIGVQVYFLIRYVNKSNEILLQFFQAIKSGNDLMFFQRKDNSPFYKSLNNAYREITEGKRKLDEKNKVQDSFLQAILSHINSALIVYDEKGLIKYINTKAGDILGIKNPVKLEEVDRQSPGTFAALMSLKTGSQQLVKIQGLIEEKEVLCDLLKFKSETEELFILTLLDIQRTIDRTEVQSYERVVRVLTHEIMNSVSPVVSLSSSLNSLYTNENNEENPGIYAKTKEGLDVILQRSTDLLAFVEKFRSLTLNIRIEKELFKLVEVVYATIYLLEGQLRKYEVDVTVNVFPIDLELYADKKLVNQVLINLLKNALQAIDKNKKAAINIHAGEIGEDVFIEVTDNGQVINKETAEMMFIPFYTSKKKGSGIGLSLSKRIMQLHDGNLKFYARDNEKVFRLEFPFSV